MSGIENDVFLMKNVNFDYLSSPPHNGIVTADGQLLIGSTANPNIAMVANTLTAGTGITITNGPGTITVASTAASSDLHVARFIVASSTAGTGANYTTIASAIAAAQGTGINSTIFLQPGTYTENITLVPGINLCAFDCDAFTPNVTIAGTLTLTTAGTVSISGIRLQTNAAAFLAVTGAAASNIRLIDCYLNCTNNTGITFSAANTSARIDIINCTSELVTTGIGLFAHSSTGALVLYGLQGANDGLSTTASTCSAGNLSILNSVINFPITYSSGSIGSHSRSTFDNSPTNTTSVALIGTSIVGGFACTYNSGTASSISAGVGTAFTLINSSIFSSNTNAITGAGTIAFSAVTFNGSSSTINTTTQTPLVITNDALKVVTPGAYPYTTVPQDSIIKVDTSSSRTIIPLASPTTGQKHIIKDTVGSAAANNITVTPSGKNIDGAASYTINSNYGSITIVYNGTEWSVV